MSPHRRQAPQSTISGALDFELTDFETARAAHDAMPPGVGTLSEKTPHYWDSRRRKPVLTDRMLTGATIDWVLSLPPSDQPRQLCDRFPRIANALAVAWPRLSARVALLDSLRAKDRGRRVGFADDIRSEIEALRHL